VPLSKRFERTVRENKMINEKCDFHTHATDYRKDNGCTVEAIIERSQELGLDIIGVGEHITSRIPLEHYRAMAAEYHRQSPSIKSYLGAEVDILDRDGQVSCSPEFQEELGFEDKHLWKPFR